MADGAIESRVKIQQVIQNHLPEFIIDESPKLSEFLKQYYISQEFQGGPVDIAENLDQYLKLDNLTPEVVVGSATLVEAIEKETTTIVVDSTKGFPKEYGLLKIDDEIITYTGITNNTFTGCIRGFSGITNYHQTNNPEELVFSSSESQSHVENSTIINLSSLFLKEFYKKLKFSLTPGLENSDFVSSLDVSNFVKQARTLYRAKGTEESFRILFKVLYNKEPKVIDLEQFLIKPSSSQYIRREVVLVERISGDPLKLVGQTIKRTKDPATQASVSEVEILSRGNRTYYKLSLFIGNNEKELIEGEFKIAGKTKVLEDIAAGSSIISVDSTIGFDDSGTIVSIVGNNTNTITYTDKTVNQFLGCTGIDVEIPLGTDIKADETIYGYEDSDITKKVELRITGILSRFNPSSENTVGGEGDKIYIKSLGDSIQNNGDTYKEIFANSWIYNTSCRYQIDKFQTPVQIILKASSDKSSLEVGDTIDIIERGSNFVRNEVPLEVVSISLDGKVIRVNSPFIEQENKKYDIRRRIKKSSSSIIPLEYNGKIISNVQNVYIDRDNELYAYVASNGFPEYTIQSKIKSFSVSFEDENVNVLENFDVETEYYDTIVFSENINFLNGDAIIYQTNSSEIVGLINNTKYYVQVTEANKIRLYTSKSFVGSDNFIPLRKPPVLSGSHKFILQKDISNLFKGQKNLKKFPLFQDIKTNEVNETSPGPVGMLINGVEIISPKSQDKIYYGPLKSINILNSGQDYDVINPPKIVISSPENGEQALVQPIVIGNIKNVFVDPQDFDVLDKNNIVATVTGGNGSGAVLKPVISERYREIEFDGRLVENGGGIDISNETITFNTEHNLSDGDSIIYNSNNNSGIGIGTYFGGNEKTGKTLVTNLGYYVEKISSNSIKLYNSFLDYATGINTVGFTTENTFGIHKFRTVEKYTLKDIKVINPGNGYQNRKLYIKSSSGISTSNSTITFENHGFSDGDKIIYSVAPGDGITSPSTISGLSTSNQYRVIKVDNDTFRLANIGIGGTFDADYVSGNYTKFQTKGSGYQVFEYPPITISVSGIFNNSQNQSVVATPVVRGSITDVYLYENGTGYGSTIVNFEKQPIIKIANGKDAEVFPVVRDGKISDITVNFGGYEYNSVPDLVVVGTGSGAKLRAVIQNEKLVDVIVLNGGIGYDDTTKIRVVSSGQGAIFSAKIRDLTINERIRYNTDEIYIENNNSLKYGIISYPNIELSNQSGTIGIATVYLRNISKSEKDSGVKGYSPLLGWAYDGNPIYGPWASSDPMNASSTPVIMRSGYVFDETKTKVFDRPPVSDDIIFVEDYIFEDAGDLDEHNGRFAKTPDFPNGVYAYYATIDRVSQEPVFPYFIGNTYKSNVIVDNFAINQDFDYDNNNLIRNTFPYCLGREYIDNDFIVESNEIIEQSSVIESVSKGSVERLDIISSGTGYKIGEKILFDNTNTSGGGIYAKVSEITGKPITGIAASSSSFDNSILVWNSDNVLVKTNTQHNFNNNDFVNISGVSTYINGISGFHKVGIATQSITLLKSIPSSASGIVTDIYVSYIPSSVSIGSSLLVGNEILKVLNVFGDRSIIRVKRYGTDLHSESDQINVLSEIFTIPVKTDYFDSKINSKVYFNPKNSIGVSTVSGIGVAVTYNVGIETNNIISIPSQSIYLPNHPFQTGQKVILSKVSSASTIGVSNTSSSRTFAIPFSGNTQELYVINKSKDFIGITTSVGLTTNTNGLFFTTNGSDDYEYSLESQYSQVKANVNKTKATISVSTAHNLLNGDIVTLNVVSNLSVGIGTSSKVKLQYDSNYGKILVNPIGFTSLAINKSSNVITLASHGLETGNKVFYKVSSGSVATGLNTGGYFVYKIDDNNIQLGKTLYDVLLPYPNIVGITSEGGNNHSLSLINPQISVVKNSKLVFDLSDSSLTGYKLQIFYDQNFENDFISTGDATDFNVIGIGTSLLVNYTDNSPKKLYYTLSKNGSVIYPDYDVENNSEITYVDSIYNNNYEIVGSGLTTFDICLEKLPERNSYLQNQTSKLEYTTKSTNASGGISKIKLISGGSNYKEVPQFIGVDTEEGSGANIVCYSKSVGNIERVRFLEQGFDYPSDKTLNPIAEVPPVISIRNSNTVSKVEVVYGGRNYINPPSLILYNPTTDEVINNVSLVCRIDYTAVSSVNVDVKPYGLDDSEHKVIAINNSNGIGIKSVLKLTDTSYKLSLITPITGYASSIFSEGDKVFVEGIKYVNGTGYNSADYGYQFFTVAGYVNTVPAEVTIDLSEFTDNIGIATDNTETFATIVNKNNYPEFSVTQEAATFREGEQLLVKANQDFELENLYVLTSKTGYLDVRVRGGYTPRIGEIIKGVKSGVIATIDNVIENKGTFEIDYSNEVNYGWITDTGKLSETYQVCPDNDYYQTLSYTVKSEIEFEKMIDPVNRLLHTSGLKNFADTEVISSTSIGVTFTSSDLTVLDIIEEKRVDTINNFDMAFDFDTRGNTSKYIKLKNKKVSDYFKCLTNRVIVIDDISQLFDDNETNQTFSDKQFSLLDLIDSNFSRYLIQIRDPDNNKISLSEIIVLNEQNGDQFDSYVLEKGLVSNLVGDLSKNFGEITLTTNDAKERYLTFIPNEKEKYESNLDIKIIKTLFNTYNPIVGVSSSKIDIGLAQIKSYQNKVGVGKTDTLVSFDKNVYKSFIANIVGINTITNNINYIELFVCHDGNDVFSAEYYIDDNFPISQNIIGDLQPKLDGNNFKLDFWNNESNNIIINAKVVGFGTTSIGETRRPFISSFQNTGEERSAVIITNYDKAPSVGTVVGVDSSLFSGTKSIVRVSYGQTSALHQVIMVNDTDDCYLIEYPHVSIGNTTGIGTFGTETTGSVTYIKFYVDPSISDDVEVQSYTEAFYTEWDNKNEYADINYQPVIEKYGLSYFNAINGTRVNQFAFEMKSNNIPIFAKTFAPQIGLDTSTGIFSIDDHFFSIGEEVTYTYDTTTLSSPLSIKINPTYSLPSTVYVYPIDKDNFGISTTKANALVGTYITSYSSPGAGNAHKFEMVKKNEKTIISIDGIVQQPLTYTPIAYNLANQVSASTTYFSLTGISSIKPNDILNVGNEYMRILSVGFGTTSIGPITEEGDYNVISVDRGIFETQVQSHSNGDPIRIYRGSFNIVQNKLYFVTPPRGSGIEDKNESNLPYPTSSFSGRVYLQKDYSKNKIYDDVSDSFNGIGRTFTLTSSGSQITGIGTGAGFIFINNIFQTPTTANNSDNNFSIQENSGISSAIFSGITTVIGGPIITTDYDVNQNQLPRGGIVVSLGSTPGLGFAPLVGASVTAVVSSGSIVAVGVGSTDFLGSGYNRQVSVAVTDTTGVGATITASIGIGGTLSFTVVNGGSGYSSNPTIIVSQPSYERMEVMGVSRLGIGATTITGNGLLVDLVVAQSSTAGIGSSALYEVQSFEIVNSGYGYLVGDVLKPIGLVTDKSLASPLIDFKLTVTEIFTDTFYGMQLGQFDYIDSIRRFQDGSRSTFPLYYNGELRSFEKDPLDPTSALVDLESAFLVFCNGVIQEPGSSYQFDGGTSITFTIPPKPEDNISIFFYQGQSGVDVIEQNIIETIKPGDTVQISKNDIYPITQSQEPRTVENIESSDELATNVYIASNENELTSIYKPLSWTKQKIDKTISGQFTYKSRNSLETLIFPTSNIIKNVGVDDNQIFVDSAELFRYDFSQNLGIGDTVFISPEIVGGVIVPNTYPEAVPAAFTATVGASGTVTSITIVNPGLGYTETTLDLVFSKPYYRGIGIGTTSASGTVTIVNGSVSSYSISSVGAGYSETNPPQVTIKSPSLNYQMVPEITKVEGFSGSIIGIHTVSIGASDAVVFDLRFDSGYAPEDLNVGYPIYVQNTNVGSPVTTLDIDGSTLIGIGTTFLDNIYIIQDLGIELGISTASVISYVDNAPVGIATTGTIKNPVGTFSWGRLVLNPGNKRLNPTPVNISGFTVTSGLSTFPYIQRKLFGIRSTGGVKI